LQPRGIKSAFSTIIDHNKSTPRIATDKHASARGAQLLPLQGVRISHMVKSQREKSLKHHSNSGVRLLDTISGTAKQILILI
jgi:hypothetical protein